ncbi:MAG: ThiF family adenylyltransferase [Muribaculaceae bacterium]
MESLENAIFNRAELLLGSEFMQAAAEKRVILFGVGGVGSWCAEGLIRSGIKHLTIVDSDRVCITNINRQMMANCHTIGQVKVEALKKRLLEVNPAAEITTVCSIYSDENVDAFCLNSYDYIIDCIDSLKDKASLILRACTTEATFFSSMGAALKLDPTKIRVDEFWKVQGCPLARAIRRRFKSHKTYPRHKFLCVYSDELLENIGEAHSCGTAQCICHNNDADSHNWNDYKAQINGSLAHITAIFGFHLSSLVLMDIRKKLLTRK